MTSFWYISKTFESTSTPRNGHPLFSGFVEAAAKHKQDINK
jgi:CTP synthase